MKIFKSTAKKGVPYVAFWDSTDTGDAAPEFVTDDRTAIVFPDHKLRINFARFNPVLSSDDERAKAILRCLQLPTDATPFHWHPVPGGYKRERVRMLWPHHELGTTMIVGFVSDSLVGTMDSRFLAEMQVENFQAVMDRKFQKFLAQRH